MFTSDDTKKDMINSAFWHLIFALFCALFGAIYELFSHEVYSFYMIYAFAIPLVLGTLTQHILAGLTHINMKGLALSFWNMAVVTLTIGCLFKGVLDIYGTTNKLILVYPAASAVLFVLAFIFLIVQRLTRPCSSLTT